LAAGDQLLHGILPDIMQAVTCFQCANQTSIAPNAFFCPVCGEDLQHLLLPETVVDYFQARAHELSERSELGAALAEAERGLSYVESSELHLLAAILAKQLGRHDRMRQHVAAIPVDDSLRGEAEWLLRSHQDRQRALHEAARNPYTQLPAPLPALSPPGTTFLEELLGGQAPDTPSAGLTHGQAIASVAIVVVAIIMVAASWWWIGPGALSGQKAPVDQTSSADTPRGTATEPALPPTVESSVATTATTSVQVVDAAPTPTLQLSATPTSAVPADLVQAPVETPELADSNPRHVMLVESNIFDIKQYLSEAGYAELAELPLNARLQGDLLVLQGIVHLDLQRRELIELAQAIPGVREVNAVDLLLRPLPTYVVQQGDTLWTIVYNIYGDVDRLDEFAAYNSDVLPAPDALAQGIVLKVLPVQ
jgi:nucleoid-associated protein YgaU